MCTAAAFRRSHLYFGRTLDYDISFLEELVLTPRNAPLPLRHVAPLTQHYALLGMARVEKGFPLYFDAMNEMGLSMAALNFTGNAHYFPGKEGFHNIASFELIPWLLGRCESVEQAKELLSGLRITDDAFSPALPPAQLHWLLADDRESIVLESTREGLQVYENPVNILTNNPPFPIQLLRLSDYMQLSPNAPLDRFAPDLPLQRYSRGLGAMGLPGDLSSGSRFVRGAFSLLNSVCEDTEAENVSQFFHILETVSQIRGCCRIRQGQYEITQYTACCSAATGTYYYTTYENRQINALCMHNEDLASDHLLRYPVLRTPQIHYQGAESFAISDNS